MLVIKCPACDSYDTDFDYDGCDSGYDFLCDQCNKKFQLSDAAISSVVGEIHRD